jgi:S1-C subfamily serine protease
MRNLQEATERICELKGSLLALDALMPAMIALLPQASRAELRRHYESQSEAARSVLLATPISELSISSFERDVRRTLSLLAATTVPDAGARAEEVEAVLLSTTQVLTFDGNQALTAASGFFFERDDRLYLVTSRHVVFDAAAGHLPNRIEIVLHTDRKNLTRTLTQSMLLYRDGIAVWHQAEDAGGEVDVAVLEIDRAQLPPQALIRAFTPAHLPKDRDGIEVGDALAIPGFPLGFHDTVHHLPVVRSATVASSYGVRFQGQGFFLTDARTHRGNSGSPVLARRPARAGRGPMLPWLLVGVHSMRMDMRTRDAAQDESLGLNCAWYADIILALTAPDDAAP